MSEQSSRTRWLREPLVHFLLLGGFFFVLHWAVTGSQSAASDRTIVLASGDVRRLMAAWEMQWRRPPTADELTNLVKEHIREEIFYREALALGLEHGDSIIRRRLAQKMQFLSEDIAQRKEPSEEELKTFFDENADRFEIPARITFTHIYFSTDKRSAKTHDDATAALESINEGAEADRFGDRFMLQRHYSGRTQDDVAGMFGAAFARDLFAAPSEGWQGPIESGYGLHLVNVEARSDAQSPPWEKARADVVAEWTEENRRTANDQLYDKLRGEYDIQIGGGLPAELGAALSE